MTPERWERIRELFHATIERNADERAVYLADACATDPSLRMEVEKLISSHEGAPSFLERTETTLPAFENLPILQPNQRVGHYRILYPIGQGGMGVVYKAEDTTLGRFVALKFLPSTWAEEPQALERFRREARAASALSHPNVCTIYAIDEDAGRPFIAMELLSGQTLAACIAGRPLATARLIELSVQIADGLQAAHELGITHRDIKPGNIFVTDKGQAKILDFGLARIMAMPEGTGDGHPSPTQSGAEESGSSLTQAGSVMGTVPYLSPEQLRGEQPDPRSDLFSLGTVMYEMATGHPAFPGSQETAVAAILNLKPPSPLLSNSELPLELERIIAKALEKNRELRYHSAAELKADLLRIGKATELTERSISLPEKQRGGRRGQDAVARAPKRRWSAQEWFSELKRRRVFRALVGYGIASFAMLQIIEPIMHGAHWPEIVLSYVVAGLAGGFPIVITLAWIFDVRQGRIERTAPVGDAVGPRGVLVALLLVGIGVLAAAPGLFYYFVLRGQTFSPRPGDSPAGGKSIAVLPFVSTGDENAYFAQGFHDELLRQMGRIGELRVISRTSVMQYKKGARNSRDIADALGVSSIVEGSVQRDGNRVRVEARLIDARNDQQVWADRYDRDVTDIFAIQTAVAEEIAGALHARLSAAQKAQIERKPTQNVEAYDLYLRALEYYNRPGYQPNNFAIAERMYQKAIQADPAFALARSRLAQVMLATYWLVAGTPDRVAEGAREEAEQSLRLQPDLPEGHFALGQYYFWGHRDYERALKEFEFARSGVPSEAVRYMGFVRRRQGRFDEAIRKLQEAVHLDPRSPDLLVELAQALMSTRRYEEADRMFNRALTMAPDLLWAAAGKAVLHEAWHGDTSLAKEVLREAREWVDPRGLVRATEDWHIDLLWHNPQEGISLLDSFEAEAIIGQFAVHPKAFLYAVAHEALGDADQARKEYETALPLLAAEVERNPSRAVPRTLLARAYAALGRKEEALREARRAVEALPISKDALDGPRVEIDCAAVEARVGETDAAIEHIRHLLSIPCLLSPGLLRIDPRWAPLRGDPRFRQIAELERE